MNPVDETCALLNLLVRAMVKDRDSVQVTPKSVPGGTCFQVRVADAEVAKVIGSKGRIARSLRQITQSIGLENGAGYFNMTVIDKRKQQNAPIAAEELNSFSYS